MENNKLKYDWVGDFFEGLAIVEKDYRFGFIDETGSEIIPVQYTQALNFHEGLANVVLGVHSGFIDKKGNVVIPFTHGNAFYSFKDGIVPVGDYDSCKWGIIDKENKVVVPFIYEMIYPLGDIFSAELDNGKSGCIDRTGKEVIPFIYDWIQDWNKGIICVGIQGKYGFIDHTGKEFLPLQYSGTNKHDCDNPLCNGFAEVVINGKWKLIDEKGNTKDLFLKNEKGETYKQ